MGVLNYFADGSQAAITIPSSLLPLPAYCSKQPLYLASWVGCHCGKMKECYINLDPKELIIKLGLQPSTYFNAIDFLRQQHTYSISQASNALTGYGLQHN